VVQVNGKRVLDDADMELKRISMSVSRLTAANGIITLSVSKYEYT
jgi:hypothetical protein